MTEITSDQLLAGILAKQDNNSYHVDWARHELELAGLFDEDSDYGGMIGQAVYDIVRLFSMQGHSGFSAIIVTDLVNKLLRFEPITENDHSEYIDRTEESGYQLWQCKRDSRYFSEDSGKTWYNVDNR